MIASLNKRLEEIEKANIKKPLIVLACTDSGEEIEIPMRECLDREDTHFIRVISGNSLEDLYAFLKHTRAEAERAGEGNEN